MQTINIHNERAVVNNLVKANHVIDKFINSCSHSLRGPLKTILGLVNLINASEKNEGNIESIVQMIERSANHLDHTLNELEQYLVNAKKEVSLETINPEVLVAEVVNLYRTELEGNGIALSTEVQQVNIIRTDKERLKMMLSLLLSNAVTFYDPHKTHRKVEVSVKTVGDSLEIRVSDNGIGIPSDIQKEIFQLFYRGSERSKGAGIGLYIVHEAAEKMGGRVEVESQVQAGSVFKLVLPLREVRKEAAKSTQETGVQKALAAAGIRQAEWASRLGLEPIFKKPF
jgi:signal transduction histidine kinase